MKMKLACLFVMTCAVCALCAAVYAENGTDGETAIKPDTAGSVPVQTVAPAANTKPADAVPAENKIMFLDAEKTVKADLNKKTLEIPATVQITTSLIELALCSTAAPSCRSHESLFVTPVKPSIIHAGLNLIGLKEGKPVEFPGQDKFPTGDLVYIFVKWTEAETKKDKIVRIEQMIRNNLTEELLEGFQWIFTGSRMVKPREGKQYYEADEEGTIIATWHYPSTVIDIPLPEGSDDTAFDACKQNMVPRGTAVTMIFSVTDIQKPAEPSAKKQESEKTEQGEQVCE